MANKVALIAGTGFYDLPALRESAAEVISTRYGSAQITRGNWNGVELIFLTRHGTGHTIPPHKINYRANLQALKDVGAASIVAINVVGGVDRALQPGDLELINDFIDFTSGRTNTFFDGDDENGVQHIDMTNVYDRQIQSALLSSAERLGIKLRNGGIYAGFDGPRFETPAEIRFAALAGATVVGMTGCPEAALARELGIPYAAIALVVNPAAGLVDAEISMADINAALAAGKDRVLSILDGALVEIAKR